MPLPFVKLFVDGVLDGSTVDELSPAERGIWYQLLALGGRYFKEGVREGLIPVTSRTSLQRLFKVPARLLDSAMAKMVKAEKITVTEEGIQIVNWKKYQPSHRELYPKNTDGQSSTKLYKTVPQDVDLDKEEDKEEDKEGTTTTGESDKIFAQYCQIYEAEIGMLSPVIREELLELRDKGGEGMLEWFRDACAEAAKNNVRRLSYVIKILARWTEEGREPRETQGHTPRHKKGYEEFLRRYGHLIKKDEGEST